MATVRTRDARDTSPETGSRGRAVFLYGALVILPAVAVVLLLAVRGHTAGGDRTSSAAAPGPDVYGRLLLALPVILLVGQGCAALCRRMSQPGVVGEILAGIVLGPSVLGLLWPFARHWLLPDELMPPINVLAQLGLVLFMFLVGHELDLRRVRGRGHALLVVSHVGVAVPMLTGVVLALGLYGPFAPAHTDFTPFALFVAVSLSITAFPVLARIVAERRLGSSTAGSMAVVSAAIGDVTAWCLLAVVVTTARHSSLLDVGRVLLLTSGFCALLWLVVRPAATRLLSGGERDGSTARLPEAAVLPALLVGIMLSALATDRIGVHAIFGAFLLGVVTPRRPAVERAAAGVRSVTETLLLPLFFVYSGLRTEIGLLTGGWRTWLWCLLVLVAAVVAKWGSTTAAARSVGLSWEDSMLLGALMNCRGLTELIVLNVGLDLGVISPTLFTVFVVMAVVSTVMTSPAVSAVQRFVRSRATRNTSSPNLSMTH
ncbi:cation:proton antiporter [Streptomyces olivaceus]